MRSLGITALLLGWLFPSAARLDERNIGSVTDAFRKANMPTTVVNYGGREDLFLVDTGSNLSVVFEPTDLLEKADPSWRITNEDVAFPNGGSEFTVIRGIPIGFAERDRRPSICAIGKNKLPNQYWYRGFLGVNELWDQTLRINSHEGRCEFLDQVAVTKVESSPNSIRLSRSVRGFVTCPISMGDFEGLDVRVDTGQNRFLRMDQGILQSLQTLGQAIPVGSIEVFDIDGPKKIKQWIVRDISLGAFQFSNVAVVEANSNGLGMGCLKHFDVVLQFSKKNMYLTPIEDKWPKQLPPDASGLVLSFEAPHTLKVVLIQQESAAARSDLQAGDQIVAFDGADPKNLSLREIEERLSQADTSVRLRIVRGGQSRDVMLALKYNFEYPPKWPSGENELQKFNDFLDRENAADSGPDQSTPKE